MTSTPPFALWRRVGIGVVVAVLVAMRLATLSSYPLTDVTEGRYAEIARQMVATGNWITPQLEPGNPYWAKPPLSFWLTALSFELLGLGELPARLPALLMSVLTVALTGVLAANLYGKACGVLSAAVLGTTALLYVMAGEVMLDPTLCATLALSMASFALALRAEARGARIAWGYAFFAGMGMGILAKGLEGPALTVAPLLVWTAWKRRWGDVWRALPWVTGSVLALLIAVPWHLAAEQRTPGFLDYYIIGEHFRRYLVSGWHGEMYGTMHNVPRGTIWAYFAAATLPWGALAGVALLWLRRRGARVREAVRDPWLAYLLLWCLTPLVFFTMARNILVTYALPALPAFSILAAASFQSVRRRAADGGAPWFISPRVLCAAGALVPVLLCVAAATLLGQLADTASQKSLVQRFIELDAGRGAALIYPEHMPYSAAFYSRGRARALLHHDPEQVHRQLQRPGRDFFAIKRESLDRMPAELLDATEEVGRFGHYVLRRKIHGATAGARPPGFRGG